MNHLSWLKKATQILDRAGVENPRLDSLILLEFVSGIDRSLLLAKEKIAIDSKDLDSVLKRRASREPIAYIVGHKEFYGVELEVNSGVLIPRPETEAVVEYIIKNAKTNASCLDLGTGSGAIAVALKLNRPDLKVTASDISESALDVAKQNAKVQDLEIYFRVSDLLENIEEKYDFIAANLPYVPLGGRSQKELDYEPRIAIYAQNQGLELYEKLAKQLLKNLSPAAKIVIEHDLTQLNRIKAIFKMFKHESITNFVSVLSAN